MPDEYTIVAPRPAGVEAGYGASLRRLWLMLHSHGQVTTQHLTALLNDVGVEISKRQVIGFRRKGWMAFTPRMPLCFMLAWYRRPFSRPAAADEQFREIVKH